MIALKNDEKLSDKSITLFNFSEESTSGVQKIDADLYNTPSFSLFPGQIVHLEGTIDTNMKFTGN